MSPAGELSLNPIEGCLVLQPSRDSCGVQVFVDKGYGATNGMELKLGYRGTALLFACPSGTYQQTGVATFVFDGHK
jgi:hypothetical protein